MTRRNISPKDIEINCIFKEDGEDIVKIIEQSFYCYMKKEIAKNAVDYLQIALIDVQKCANAP